MTGATLTHDQARALMGAVRRTEGDRRIRWTSAAGKGALWAAQSYLRAKSPYRTRNRYGTPLPTLASWEALAEEEEVLLPAMEDPAAGAVDRVAAAQLWRRLSAPLSARDRVILERTLGRQERCEDVAPDVGLSLSGLKFARRRALEALRARLNGQEMA